MAPPGFKLHWDFNHNRTLATVLPIINELERNHPIVGFIEDPLPWTENWDITAYGTEGVMHSRPMPASYKLYSTGKAGLPEGWTERTTAALCSGPATRSSSSAQGSRPKSRGIHSHAVT